MRFTVSRSAKSARSGLAIRFAALAACAASGLISAQAGADIAGFTPADFSLNANTQGQAAGVPSITDGVLKSTSNTEGNATSAFFNTPQNITNFTASYVYDLGVGSVNPADGVAFVVQNDPRGLTALGDSGGALGYLGGNGINNSVALALDIWNGGNAANPTRVGIGSNRTGFGWQDTTPVNLRGNPVRVDIAYRDGIVSQTLTDTVSGATASRLYYSTIPLYTGANTALVGFTGGTGGANAEQFISNFTYTAGNAPVPTPPPTTPLLANVPTGGMGVFGVREVTGAGPMGNIAQAEAGVTGPAGTRTDYTAGHINILDTGNPGDFTGPLNPDNPYRSNSANVGDPDQISDTAVVATGVIRIPVAGAYTFGVSSDDGFRLTIGGRRFENAVNSSVNAGGSLEFNGGRGADNVSLGTVILPAGDHPIQLLNWEGGGGASVELIAAPGVHNSLNASFNLVGAPEQTVVRRTGNVANGFNIVNFNGVADPDGDGPLTRLDAAVTAFEEFEAGTRTPSAQRTDPTVFLSDPENRGADRNNQNDFGSTRPFPNNASPGDENDFATAATGKLSITTGGIYTFDVVSDDSFRFRLTDSSGNDVDLLGTAGGGTVGGVNTDADAAMDAFRTLGCCSDSLGSYDLPVGEYDIEVIMQEGGGGASFSLYGAYGQWSGFDPFLFQLVGQNLDTTTVRSQIQLVPEPGTFAMLGIAGLGLLARKRRK